MIKEEYQIEQLKEMVGVQNGCIAVLLCRLNATEENKVVIPRSELLNAMENFEICADATDGKETLYIKER